MKKTLAVTRFTQLTFVQRLAIFLVLTASAASLVADVVYVTSRPSPRGKGANTDGTFNDADLGDDTTAFSTAPGTPARTGSRYYSNSFSNSTPDYGITITPTLGIPGMVYQVDHTYSSTAENVSSNLVLRVTNVEACTLSFTNNIDKFQAQYGRPAPQSWQFLGYLTNAPGSATPAIRFFYQSGTVAAISEERLEVDCFRFTSLDPCITVSAPRVTGPLATNIPNVTVTDVVTNATNVVVYQNAGAGMVQIASLNLTNPLATVSVPVSGLVKGAQVGATQKVKGQSSCVPTAGTRVGGGANPGVRVTLSVRGNPELTGPVGAASSGTNANIYFLGALDLLENGCPDVGVMLEPGTNWQTVTLTRGTDPFNPIDPVVLWNDGGGASFELEGNFGALDGLAFACQGDSGPYDLYLDDLANGTNGVFQSWEAGTPGSAFGFVPPRASGTTSGNLLSAPEECVVVTNTAFSGSRCLRVRWQFAENDTNLWLRLVTAGAAPVENPQVDLNEPISFKILLLRPGEPVPPAPAPASPGPIAIERSGNNVILSWAGAWQLQSAPMLSGGAFTNVPGITTSPYTNNIGPGTKFYRLRN